MKSISILTRILLVFLLLPSLSQAQTSMTVVNLSADSVLKGNYTPLKYNPTTTQRLPDSVIKSLLRDVSSDSIKSYWTKIGSFYNRSSGNQLSSTTQGITAAFSYVSSKFQQFRTVGGNRLLVSNFTFTQSICSASQHTETFAVLPGNSTTDKSILILSAHLDSRSSVSCPASTVMARGMEDNATGVALLMELARVMSKYSYTRSIVFLITTGEEQGCYGSQAFATYLKNKSVPILAVLNNDIVGSVYCQLPVSSPGCTVNNGVDTTHIRLFSGGAANSKSKSWVRYIKLEYKENLQAASTVQTGINIMTDIDRTGRSSDHVPFYNLGYTSARLSCANESGDGSGTSGREHSTLDSGGVDKNKDGTLDSFFVSFNYLKRNAQINGNAIAMAACSPNTPTYTVTNLGSNKLKIVFNTQTTYPAYRVGVRTSSFDFDTVYTFTKLIDTMVRPASSTGYFYVSAASQDANKVESMFGGEVTITAATVGSSGNGRIDGSKAAPSPYDLLPNFPNPFDDATCLTVVVKEEAPFNEGFIRITTIDGRLVKDLPISLHLGNNQVVFNHSFLYSGMLVYSLYVGGNRLATRTMIMR